MNDLKQLLENIDFEDESQLSLLDEKLKEFYRVSYLESEMKNAFASRDKVKAKFRELQELKNKPDKLLELEILKSAQKHKAYSPSQVFTMLRDRFQKEDEEYFHVDANGKKIPLDTYIQDFLNAPENDNLRLSDIIAGTFHSNASHTGKEKLKFSKSDLEEADDKNLTIEDFLEIKQIRDLKMKGRKRQNVFQN
jgi:hypothetical protein